MPKTPASLPALAGRRASRARRLILGSLACLAALGLAGCASWQYTDPGPQAARLVVSVKGQVTPEQRAEAAEPYGGLKWAGFPPRYNEYSEPLWDVQAFILAPDGGLHQLPPAPGKAVHEQVGYSLDTTAEFLVPPGTHKIRFLVTNTVERTYVEDFATPNQHQYLTLYAKELVRTLELCPNCTVKVEGLTGR